MKTLAALALVLVALAPLPTTAADDLTGKWTGSFTIQRPDGSSSELSVELNLTQKGTALTGTAGPNASAQWKVENGVVKDAGVTFDVQGDGPVMHFTLTLTGGRLVGEAVAEHNGQKRLAKIDAGRAK